MVLIHMIPLAALKLHLEQKTAAVQVVQWELLLKASGNQLAYAYEIELGQLEL